MINFLIWLVVGAIIGWIASLIMNTDGRQGTIIDIVVGVVGAFLAGLVLTPMLGIGTINDNNFSIPSLLVSLVGAVVLIAIVKVLRRGNTRTA